MISFRKIICPTDFSEASLEGVKAGNSIADTFSSELILVHIVSPILPVVAPVGVSESYDISGYNKEMRSSAMQSISDLADKMISEGITAKGVILEGRAADRIVELANDQDADVIIIATHGVTGWKRLISGSVTEKVVRLACCPVLTIPVPSTSR